MHDFGRVCYLDTQKTGSTFVNEFLNAHMAVPALKQRKHRPAQRTMRVGRKFFFISAREPLAQYESLYRYGMDGNGRLYAALRRLRGASALYRGNGERFGEWLRFVLDPQNAEVLGDGYDPAFAHLFGFQTHRFLRLSFYRPQRMLARMTSREDVLRLYEAHKLHRCVIRQETLNEDLAALCEGALAAHLKDAAAAAATLRATPQRTNTSRQAALSLAPDLVAEIEAREWFLYDVLGYVRPSERPST